MTRPIDEALAELMRDLGLIVKYKKAVKEGVGAVQLVEFGEEASVRFRVIARATPDFMEPEQWKRIPILFCSPESLEEAEDAFKEGVLKLQRCYDETKELYRLMVESVDAKDGEELLGRDICRGI